MKKNKAWLRTASTKNKGDQYEKCALAFCRRKGIQVVAQNLRFKEGEIDCLAWDPKQKSLIVIEVRGRTNARYLPSRFISPKKLNRLKSMALTLSREKKCSVRIYLLEVIGNVPREKLQWGLEFFPEALGLRLRDYEIDFNE
jgi:Holliday junction resolvase-like predicted endonuclease